MTDTRELAAKVDALTNRVAELESKQANGGALSPGALSDSIRRTIRQHKRLGTA